MTETEFARLSTYVHDARKPLNRISMQAELVKMALSGDVPVEKAVAALDKIIVSAKDCSSTLSDMSSEFGDSSME